DLHKSPLGLAAASTPFTAVTAASFWGTALPALHTWGLNCWGYSSFQGERTADFLEEAQREGSRELQAGWDRVKLDDFQVRMPRLK
ncbi:hypothetical protein ILYODFUR_004231, partial [Ilyodon furcidens]